MKKTITDLQSEYNSILHDNAEIQKEVAELGKQAGRLEEFSIPIRVVNVAFRSNNSLK